jgi:hypothetical protein
MFGGSTPTPQVTPTTQFPNSPQAAQNLFSGIGGLDQFSLGGQTLPEILQLAQGIGGAATGPQGQFATGTAGQIAPQLVQGGQGLIGAGQGLTGAAQGMLPYVQQILGQAFDPQGAVYNQALSQTQNQTGANLANTGVGSTPYGASVMGNTLGNFNLGWQNNLLNRQATGLGAAGGALGQIGGAEQTGGNLISGGGDLAMQGGMLPFATLQGLNTAGMQGLSGAIGAGNQASQVPQTAIGDWLNYLSGGNQAISQNNAANLAAANFQAQQQQQEYQNIASAFGGIGSLGGGLFGAGGIFGKGRGGGAFSGLFSGSGGG